MRKFLRIISILTALASLASLCSCIGNGGADPTPAPTAEVTTEPTAAPTPTATPEPTEAPTPEPTATPDPVAAYVEECAEAARLRMERALEHIEKNPIEGSYETYPFIPADKRAELDEAALPLYDAMLSAAGAFEPIELEAEDKAMDDALFALFWDHPEVEVCFTMEKDKESGVWRSVYFLPEGTRKTPAEDMEAVRAQVMAFQEVGRLVASMIPEGYSAVDKYRALAYYISITSQYCYTHGNIPPYATCAYGALIKGYSICQGYALGFEYLCRCADLDCRRVRNAYNDENMHFWDIVTLETGTYYVDVTWSDGSVDVFTERGWITWFMFPADHYHVADDGSSTTGAPFSRVNWK